MTIIFISGLALIFGFLFLRNKNDEYDENSGLKALIFLLLIAIVSVFYYKTNRVTIVSQLIQIDPYRAYCEIQNNDTVLSDYVDEIIIHNRFASGSYQSGIKKDKSIKKSTVELNILSPKELQANTLLPDSIETNYNTNTSNTLVYGVNKKGLERFIPIDTEWPDLTLRTIFLPISKEKKDNEKIKNINIIDISKDYIVNQYEQKFLKLRKNECGKIYEIITTSSAMPRLIPVYISDSIANDTTWSQNKTIISRYLNTKYRKDNHNVYNITDSIPEGWKVEGYDKDKVESEYEKHMNKCAAIVGCLKEKLNIPLSYKGTLPDCIFDFFTAADISQYTLSLAIRSKCNINNVRIEYDIPIEIASSGKDLNIGTKSFGIYGDLLKSSLDGHAMIFHIKLPTMANLQQIRNLILTTILTVLITLFLSCLNNIYVYRKDKIYDYIKRKIKNSERSKTKIQRNKIERIYKIYLYSGFTIAIGITLWLVVCLYNDNPIFMSENTYNISINIIFDFSFSIS